MTSLGDRIKDYENCSRFFLTKKTPVIIRVDGKAFHSYTKNLDKPFDDRFISAMRNAACMTANEMQGFKLAYVQSDEATFFLSDTDSIKTEAWFNNNLNKLVSVSASLMTHYFNFYMNCSDEIKNMTLPLAVFDSRAFQVPPEEVANVFLWRAQDWKRNSVQMFARTFFSHKELIGKNTSDIHKMLSEVPASWVADNMNVEKNGTYILKTDRGIQFLDFIFPNYDQINDLVNTSLEGKVYE